MDAFDCKNVSCDFAEIVRCCSPVMIWGQKAGAAGTLEETLACLSWRRLLGWLLGKSSRAKSSDISSPGNCGVGSTTFEKSTARKLSVVNQRKNCQQRNTRRAGEEILGINPSNENTRSVFSFYFLISLTWSLQTCRYLWSEYCLDATPERLSALTRRLNKSKKLNS